jgi:dihydrofolate synthase/folylpolyglutamate synthase
MNPLPDLAPCRAQLSYEEALGFWFGCINYEQRTPLPDDLKLEPMRALLARLGNPQDRLRIVHVAGSKGKGSTSAMLATILREAGYRVGLFTSPHLCRVEERIQIDGQPITPNELASLMTEIREAVHDLRERSDLWTPDASSFSPTFFEVATALGFLHFQRRRTDCAIIEVGLGGRLDSTNVCLPEVALITSISFDHTRQLGNRLASIATEKAGIVKSGRRVVSGATGPEARAVIEQICCERRAPVRQLGTDIQYLYYPAKIDPDSTTHHSPLTTHAARVEIRTTRRTWSVMELGLLGEHQAANAAVAVACIEELQARGWQIPDAAVKNGLAGLEWPARLEVISHRPLVVLDCAHNVASAQALARALEESFPPVRRLLIFASSNDKDVAGMFRVLAPLFSHVYLTRNGDNPRSVPPTELVRLLTEAGATPCTPYTKASDAWEAARDQARPNDLICITGSVFLAGELRPILIADR